MHPPLLFVPLLIAAAVGAQRPAPTIDWQKRLAVIEYGAVPVGKHTLAELAIGSTWRLGMNEASTLRLELPVLAGDAVLAPGSYRIQLQRTGETACSLLVNGSGQALGGTDGAVPGDLGKADKSVKKLSVEWHKRGGARQGNQPAQIVVQFGADEWVGDVTLVGHKAVSLPGWKLAVFSLPTEVLERGAAVPVATLGKGDQVWNVVYGPQVARLVPCMAAPTASFGFGEVVPPDAGLTTTGEVGQLDLKVQAPRATLEPLGASIAKGQTVLDLGYGTEAVRLMLPEPKARAGK